jgi:hypothetical protein
MYCLLSDILMDLHFRNMSHREQGNFMLHLGSENLLLKCNVYAHFVCRFHTFNGSRPSETVSPGSNIPDEDLYARLPPDTRTPRGWLVDLINR